MSRMPFRIRARRPGLVGLGLLTALWGCVQVYPPQSGPPGGGAAAESAQAKGPFKPWKDVLEDTRPISGFLTFHLKRDNTLYLEIAPDQLEKPFGLAMFIGQGAGVFDLQQGLTISNTQLMRLHRVGDEVYLVQDNPRFTADEGSPMRRSMEGNVGRSIAAAFDVVSEQDGTGHILVDATDFFVSDYAGMSRQLEFYYGHKPIHLDGDRSYVSGVQAFPKNDELDVMLTYAAEEPPPSEGEGLPDWRSVPVGIRYSMFALPEKPMQPRLADDRVGYFLTSVEDFSRDQQVDPFLRYVNRWRLEKKDPSAAVSEPVKPIVYYVDRSVPERYRKYVKEAIEGWNRAFRAAGFEHAIEARDPPDDSSWNAEDIRYSTIRWTAAYRMGYAIGPSNVDPRTGEILNADILISSEFLRAWRLTRDDLFPKVTELPDRRLPPVLAGRACLEEAGVAQQLGVQVAALTAFGRMPPGDSLPESIYGPAIREVLAHEVGHTLGLRHNFKSSAGTPYDRLQDTSFSRKNGLTLSVMDYAPVNISPDPDRQGDYWSPVVGSYDLWAIRYGYEPVFRQSPEGPLATSGELATTPEEERAGLAKIAAESSDPMHLYGTDEDNWLGPYALDPTTNAWDLGSDPLHYARDRVALVREVEPKLEDRLVQPGEGYPRLRLAIGHLLRERFNAVLPAVKYVGGVYVVRDHRGQPGARMPLRPVPAARQRAALQLLVEEVFAEDAFRFPPELLNRLAPDRWSDWSRDFIRVPLDFPVHQVVAAGQGGLLDELLDPARLQRMIDNEARVSRPTEAFTVGDLLGALTSAIWSELGDASHAARPVDSFRRNLQRMYLDHLVGLLLPPRVEEDSEPTPVPEDARSLARLELSELSGRLGRALTSGAPLDRETKAHFDESKARIDRALQASTTLPVQE